MPAWLPAPDTLGSDLAAGLSLDEVYGDERDGRQVGAGRVGAVGDFSEETADAESAEDLGLDAHRRQRWNGLCAELKIVETDDADVAGDRQAKVMRHSHNGKGVIVIGAQDGGGPIGAAEQALDDARGIVVTEWLGDDERWVDREAGGKVGTDEAVQSLGERIGLVLTGQERDASMAQAEQILRRGLRAAEVVGQNGVVPAGRVAVVDEDDVGDALGEAVGDLLVGDSDEKEAGDGFVLDHRRQRRARIMSLAGAEHQANAKVGCLGESAGEDVAVESVALQRVVCPLGEELEAYDR